MKGGKLSSQDLQALLKKSYEGNLADHNNFKVDKELSGQRVQVYFNPTNSQTVVVHRGTASANDWITNANYALGNKNTTRFKHAEKVQRKAEAKYGTSNLTTIGHSLGSRLSEDFGKRGKEIITLDKPVVPYELAKKVSGKQTDIRTNNDVVSILRPYQRGKKEITIQSNSFNQN
jgi:hypothetical protein